MSERFPGEVISDLPPQPFNEDCYCEEGCVLIGRHDECLTALRQAAQGVVDAAPAALAALRGAIARSEWELLPWYAKLWKRLHGEQKPCLGERS